MPSAEDRVEGPALIQEPTPLPDRQFVVKTAYPTFAIIEVSQPFFGLDVVAVFRPRGIAADFRLVIDGLAVCERT